MSTRALVRNAADEEQVERAGEREKRGRELELDDVRALMRNRPGRRFMWRVLDACGVFRSSFTGDNATFFNEGQRNIGLLLMADINEACPELYATMLAEARKREDDNG